MASVPLYVKGLLTSLSFDKLDSSFQAKYADKGSFDSVFRVRPGKAYKYYFPETTAKAFDKFLDWCSKNDSPALMLDKFEDKRQLKKEAFIDFGVSGAVAKLIEKSIEAKNMSPQKRGVR